jgi:two-component system LytT family response regulator
MKTLLIDDERLARNELRRLLVAFPHIAIVGEASTAKQARELIGSVRPDLVFLDVQMPGCNGFEALAKAGSSPAVVFVTAYNEHALQAFEVNAIDYLLKPYDDRRFHSALARAKDEVRRRHVEVVNSRLSQLLDYLQARVVLKPAPEPEPPADDRILIKSSGEIFFLKADEIDWIEAEGDYMKFHTAARSHLMRETMARLEARLDPRKFIRIHRSTIVNIDRLRKLSPSFAGEYAVILHDGTKLKLSRGYHERIATLLRQKL